MLRLYMAIKNVVIGIAIIILTISVAVYGISTFYPDNDYSDYCDEFRSFIEVNNSEQCDAAEGKWNAFAEPRPVTEKDGYCNLNYYCEQEYMDASEKRAKFIFLIAVPLGILVIILGAIAFGLEAVGAGIMGGGVGIILYGVGGFWEFAQDWLKFLLSLLGLIILIWFAHWFNNRKPKKKRRKK
jgi:hypothetical protein